MISIVSIVEKWIYKQAYSSNTQEFLVLVKLEPCIILRLLVLYLGESEPYYSYTCYRYKEGMYLKKEVRDPIYANYWKSLFAT